MKKTPLNTVIECLDSGLTLELQVVYGSISGKHVFRKGDITRERTRGRVRTTHKIGGWGGRDKTSAWLWLSQNEIERLAEQATEKMQRQLQQWWE